MWGGGGAAFGIFKFDFLLKLYILARNTLLILLPLEEKNTEGE